MLVISTIVGITKERPINQLVKENKLNQKNRVNQNKKSQIKSNKPK